jgi:hypothetical protein
LSLDFSCALSFCFKEIYSRLARACNLSKLGADRLRRQMSQAEDVVSVMGILIEKQRNLRLDMRGSKNIAVQTKKDDAVNYQFWAYYVCFYVTSNEMNFNHMTEAYFIYFEASSP